MNDKEDTNQPANTDQNATRQAEIAQQTRVVQQILEANRDDLNFQSAVRGVQNQTPRIQPVKRPPR